MTKVQAWQKANEIFPDSDYEYDAYLSQRAGYPVYRSTKEGSNAHINDLGCRLEVCFHNYSECVNIYFDDGAEEVNETEMTEKEISEAVEEKHACEKFGAEMAREIVESTVYRKFTFSVDGNTWNTNETEKLVYRSMGKDLAVFNAGDLVSAYCDAHGVKWGSIEDVHISHCRHGNSSGGHYIITAYVSERI